MKIKKSPLRNRGERRLSLFGHIECVVNCSTTKANSNRCKSHLAASFANACNTACIVFQQIHCVYVNGETSILLNTVVRKENVQNESRPVLDSQPERYTRRSFWMFKPHSIFSKSRLPAVGRPRYFLMDHPKSPFRGEGSRPPRQPGWRKSGQDAREVACVTMRAHIAYWVSLRGLSFQHYVSPPHSSAKRQFS